MLSCLYDYVYFVFFMSYHALGKKKKRKTYDTNGVGTWVHYLEEGEKMCIALASE